MIRSPIRSPISAAIRSGFRPGISSAPRTTLQKMQAYGGLTFFKDFAANQSSMNADFSVGSATGTITAARTGSALATYFDANGVMQTLTTANAPRWTQGFYDETGWKSRPGLLIERGALTNRALQSQAFADAAWTKTNMTATDAVALAGSPAATVSTLAATAANATITQAYTDAAAGIYTASLFVKRKTGSGTINLRANTGDSYTNITALLAGGAWVRVPVSSSSLTNPTFDLQIVASGDELYAFQADLVKSPYMTSPIPVTTTARTRPAETPAWPISGNRTASAESMFVKFTPLGATFSNNNIQRTLSATDTKDRVHRKLNTGAVLRIGANSTDSASATATGVASPVSGQSVVAAYALSHADPLRISRVYLSGAQDGADGAVDFIDPAWGANFYLGTASAGNNQLDGIIESVAIYSGYKEMPDANHISFDLSSAVTRREYSLEPDTYSATNLINGGASGNQIVNTTYQFNDALVRLNTTTALLYRRIGQDGDNVEPAGNITLKVFDITTKTFGSESTVYVPGAVWQTKHHFVRVVGTEVWMYLVLTARPLGSSGTTKTVLVKSTDGGITFGSEISVQGLISGDPNIGGYIKGAGSTEYLVMIGRSGGSRLGLVPSTDGGTTFGAEINVTVANNGQNWGEADFLNVDNAGRIIGVLRDNAGAVLAQMVSSDWGVTWSAPFSTGLGAVTGAKVTPKIIRAAGDPTRVVVYTTDRGAGNQTKISGPTLATQAFAGTWRPLYSFASGFSNQGNGAIVAIDETLREYLMTTANEVTGPPTRTDTHWWRFRDLYTWTPV